MVREPICEACSLATMTCLISLMPERTAENSRKVACVVSAMILASEVLPIPGGRRGWIPAESTFPPKYRPLGCCCGSLAGRFVEQDAGGYRGVEAFGGA